MISILLLYLIIKSFSSFAKPNPYQHCTYEPLFTSLSASYPGLWSRAGPRPYIHPSSILARLKWRLINYSSSPGMSYSNNGFAEDPPSGIAKGNRHTNGTGAEYNVGTIPSLATAGEDDK